MFFRSKQSGNRTYIQLVENQWKSGKSRQRVIATVGRLDKVVESGLLDTLLRSAIRFNKNSINYSAALDDDAYLSTHQVGRLLQVSPSTVVSWINQGRLRASRTPGGHRRVLVKELRRFVEAAGSPRPPALAPVARKRVLVVDDDPLVIRGIERAIAHAAGDRVEVEGCTDGIQALVLIGARQPDLVLLDIYMEGIDGFEVCRRVRQIPDLHELKLVAMTAYPSEEARARILDYGATDYWAKPVSPAQVLALLGIQPGDNVPA